MERGIQKTWQLRSLSDLAGEHYTSGGDTQWNNKEGSDGTSFPDYIIGEFWDAESYAERWVAE